MESIYPDEREIQAALKSYQALGPKEYFRAQLRFSLGPLTYLGGIPGATSSVIESVGNGETAFGAVSWAAIGLVPGEKLILKVLREAKQLEKDPAVKAAVTALIGDFYKQLGLSGEYGMLQKVVAGMVRRASVANEAFLTAILNDSYEFLLKHSDALKKAVSAERVFITEPSGSRGMRQIFSVSEDGTAEAFVELKERLAETAKEATKTGWLWDIKIRLPQTSLVTGPSNRSALGTRDGIRMTKTPDGNLYHPKKRQTSNEVIWPVSKNGRGPNRISADTPKD